MRFLRLTLSPDLVLMGDAVEQIEVLNNQYLNDGTVIELSRIESDQDISELFEANPATIDYDILQAEGNQQYVYHHLQPTDSTFPHQLISLLDEHRLLIIYPIRFTKYGASLTLMGTTEKVQDAYAQLPDEIRQYITIEQITEMLPTVGGYRSLLTERQREVLDAAIELGYYAIPRRVTAAEVADAVGCAPSTASEHLRKIEANVLSGLRE